MTTDFCSPLSAVHMSKQLFSALLSTLLIACGGSGGGRYADHDDSFDYQEDARDESVAEARQAIYGEWEADADGAGADPIVIDAYDVENSENYTCTDDCSGHEAGFEWAQENDIGDEGDCGGNSMSFVEGCEAFAQARQEQAALFVEQAAEEAAQDVYDQQDAYESEE